MSRPSSLQPLPPETIKARLVALIQAVLLDNNRLEEMVKASNFKSHFMPVILQLIRLLPNMIGPMLDSISEEDITRTLEMMRDEFIPFLLGTPRAPGAGIHPEDTPLLAELGNEKSFRIDADENSPQG